MSLWVWIILIAAGLGLLTAAVGAFYLTKDSVSKAFDKRVSNALQWWSQTDERLNKMAKAELKYLHNDVRDLISRSEEVTDETFQRLQDLRARLAKTIDRKREE